MDFRVTISMKQGDYREVPGVLFQTPGGVPGRLGTWRRMERECESGIGKRVSRKRVPQGRWTLCDSKEVVGTETQLKIYRRSTFEFTVKEVLREELKRRIRPRRWKRPEGVVPKLERRILTG